MKVVSKKKKTNKHIVGYSVSNMKNDSLQLFISWNFFFKKGENIYCSLIFFLRFMSLAAVAALNGPVAEEIT